MCKTCAQGVYTLSKSSGCAYILCAGYTSRFTSPAYKLALSTTSTHVLTPYFSTLNTGFLPLLSGMLSPLYTGPITNTTKYINK
jgi:hypothetical protein